MEQFKLDGLHSCSDVLPESEHPANRLMEHSAEYLADAELLALIIGTRCSPADSLQTARLILSRAGTLHRAGQLSLTELMAIPKVGKATACAIHAAFALACRRLKPFTEQRPLLQTPSDVADLLRGTFLDRKQEDFHVLLLDTKHGLIRNVMVTRGLLDRSQIHARECFREAIRDACSRVILTHNHPSGDPTPSAQDISCTKNLVSAGKIVGIEVLDHVVIGRPTANRPRDWLSFREEGLL